MDRGPPAQQMMESNRPMDLSQQPNPSLERDVPPGYRMTTPTTPYDHNLIHVQMDSNSKKRSHPSVDVHGDNPRKRASVAVGYCHDPHFEKYANYVQCNICRSRKSRCDGGRPKCKLCMELNADCIYQEPGVKLDAGDKLILERFDKLEAMLAMMHGSELHEMANLATRYGSTTSAASATAVDQRVAPMQVPESSAGPTRNPGTLYRLPLDQWPKLREMTIGPYSPAALQGIESERQLLPPDASLSLDFTDNESLIEPFFDVVNYAFPLIDKTIWPRIYGSAQRVDFREGLDSCLVLLVLALGAASSKGPIASLSINTEEPGLPYFRSAFQLLSLTLTDKSPVAIQCIILATLYYLYLVRPMEAYYLVSALPPKLQLLPRIPGDAVINRLTHTTYVILASFAHFIISPDLSLIQLSDSIQHPALTGPPYSDHGATTWPFVAQITYARLYYRILADIALPDATQGPVAAALDQQLTDWWCTQVPVPDRQTPVPPVRGPLSPSILINFRMKYFLARLQIYKPYLIGVLTDESIALQPLTICKDSCISGLDSAVRVLEDLPSLMESAGVSFNPFESILAVTDAALMVIASSMSVNLANLMPNAKVLDGLLNAVLSTVARWSPTSPAIARAGEALQRAANGRAVSMR